MDKKTIIGLILIFLVFMGYMWWTAPSKEEIAAQKAKRDSMILAEQLRIDSLEKAQALAQSQNAKIEDGLYSNNDSTRNIAWNAAKNELGAFSNNIDGDTLTLEVKNKLLQLQFTNIGAYINSAILTQYRTFDSLPLQMITSDRNLNLMFSTVNNKIINTEELVFKTYYNGEPVTEDATFEITGDSAVVSMRAYANNEGDASLEYNTEKYLEFCYTIYPESYLIGFDIRFHGLQNIINSDNRFMDLTWNNKLNRQEKNKENERRNSSIYYKPVNDGVDYISEGKDKVEKLKTPLRWVSFKQQYFCNVLIAESEFVNADIETKTNIKDTQSHYLCDMGAIIGIPYEPTKNYSMDMQFYYGPSKYSILSDIGMELDHQIPLGWGFFLLQWINRFVVIPVFNFLDTFNWNYGFIILVLTVLVKLVLLPVAYKSYRSSAVMKVLQPEVNEINARYPKQEDALKKQQSVMALYKKAGVNPMLGCIPLLLQLPILYAMFRFFPACIELRQQGFWWVDDLSSYDSIINLGFNIPFYGDHVSLWCLLMAAVNLAYTHMTMSQTSQVNAMPGMKFMMYAMPVMMLFLLNSFSSALNYYYFLSMCITILQMWLIRKLTNEEKIRKKIQLATINAKSKPVKKSKFMTRIEEMQRINQEMERQRNNQNTKKR